MAECQVDYDLVFLSEREPNKRTLQVLDRVTGSLPPVGASIHYLGVNRQYRVKDIVYHAEKIDDSPCSRCKIAHIEVIIEDIK
ncbi:MAG TPA: hypothetical protein VMC07_01445 [Candidatus Omnitrophota bacterium]|nr:hypothetical protein [Candidatus Omnitrophota bacterium]